jgi:hypothetical protein
LERTGSCEAREGTHSRDMTGEWLNLSSL